MLIHCNGRVDGVRCGHFFEVDVSDGLSAGDYACPMCGEAVDRQLIEAERSDCRQEMQERMRGEEP